MTVENNANEMNLDQEIGAVRRLLEKVKSRVAEGKSKVSDYEKQIDEINADLASSGESLKNVKNSLPVGILMKAKMKGGISAEEARDMAGAFDYYANTVTHIASEEQRRVEVQESLSKAVDTVTKREFVQERIEDLLDAVGDMD